MKIVSKEANAFDAEMGNRIRFLMSLYDITVTDLARQINVNPKTLYKYLNGSHIMPHENLVKICNCLKCPIDYVYSGRPEAFSEHYLDDSEELQDFVSVYIDHIDDKEKRKKIIMSLVEMLLHKMI